MTYDDLQKQLDALCGEFLSDMEKVTVDGFFTAWRANGCLVVRETEAHDIMRPDTVLCGYRIYDGFPEPAVLSPTVGCGFCCGTGEGQNDGAGVCPRCNGAGEVLRNID